MTFDRPTHFLGGFFSLGWATGLTVNVCLKLVKQISLSQFVDKEHGEWIGYLSRQGDVSMDFKGGPYKGMSST